MFGAMMFAASACTFLVSFAEKDAERDVACDEGCDAGKDVAYDVAEDTAHDASADVIYDAPADTNPCDELAEGALCGHVAMCTCAYCAGGKCSQTGACPLGFNWDASQPLARCCEEGAVLTNTRDNCGVCGFQCVDAQVCEKFTTIDRYFCTGCDPNTDCPSGCCSHSPAPNHCAPSNCTTGACNQNACPSPSKCVTGPPNYCVY
jgi:hypothetical protein